MSLRQRPNVVVQLAGVALSLMSAVPALALESLVFEHVTVIDGTGGAPQSNMTVVLDGERIAAVASDGTVDVPSDARRIDARGQYLIPGMMDLHLHLMGGGVYRASRPPGERDVVDLDQGLRLLQSWLYFGFTSVLDVGNNHELIMVLRDQERAGEVVAPRIFATGQQLAYPGNTVVGPGAIGVREWPETIKDLDLVISRKPDLQKVTYESRGYGPVTFRKSMPKELMTKIIAYLEERGIRTVVHISNEKMAIEAIEAGADTLAHAPHSGYINQAFADMVAEKKIPIQTAMTIHWEISQMVNGLDVLRTPEYQATAFPEDLLLLEKMQARYTKIGYGPYFALVHEYEKHNLKMIHDAGGILGLAADRSFGATALTEMELLADAGIAPSDIIRIATLNAAIFLGKEDELGSIEAGKLADLVLLNADPTADITHVKQIEMVIKGGAIIDRSQLNLPINKR
jgi:imidazolonepropionase-like amidohydrolase